MLKQDILKLKVSCIATPLSMLCIFQLSCVNPASLHTNAKARSSLHTNVKSQASEPASDLCNYRFSGEEHFGQANGLADVRESDKALKEYNCALQKGVDTVELRIQLGWLLAKQLNRHEDAVEQFQIAAQRDGANWRAHWPLAQSLLELKRYDEALAEFLIAKKLDAEGDDDGLYRYYIGKALDGLQQYDEALIHYKAFLQHEEEVLQDSPKMREVKERIKVISKYKLINGGEDFR